MIIRNTVSSRPLRAIIYGPDGVGKSTFCADSKGAVFIPTEDGLVNIDARAVDKVSSWAELIDSVKFLAKESSCETIVIDALDGAERLCWSAVCERGNGKGAVASIESFGYGAGFTAALEMWSSLVHVLDRSNKSVLLIAHSERKTVKNPTGEDYDSIQIKLHAKAASMLREWVDVVGFAEFRYSVSGDKNAKKAVGSGKRVLRTGANPSYSSKSRFDIPACISLEWPLFESEVEKSRVRTVEDLKLMAVAKIAEIEASEVREAANKYLSSAAPSKDLYRRCIESAVRHIEKQVQSNEVGV